MVEGEDGESLAGVVAEMGDEAEVLSGVGVREEVEGVFAREIVAVGFGLDVDEVIVPESDELVVASADADEGSREGETG